MKIDGVFSGGGIKAYAYIGALEALREKDLAFERMAGTSAGAIVAALLAAGFESNELEEELMETDLVSLLDPPKWSKVVPFSKALSIYFQMGIYKGDALENWLSNLLAKKNVRTFRDIPHGYLRVIVSDVSLKKLIVVPDDLQRVYGLDAGTFPVATAVRMSAGFPYFFMPKKLIHRKHRYSMMVDGGILSNFPLWLFEDEEGSQTRPVLGIRLHEENNDEHANLTIKNAVEMFQGLFSTMKLAHDSRFVSLERNDNIVYIPVQEINPTNFSRNREENDRLIETGYEATKTFLKRWPR